MTDLTIQFDQVQEQRQLPLGWLIGATQLLAMSAQQLAELTGEELARNPALEVDETARCPVCGKPGGNSCPACSPVAGRSGDATIPGRDWIDASQAGEDTDEQQFARVAAVADPRDQLRADAHAALAADRHAIADLVIDSLDTRGLLATPVNELAKMAGVPRREVEHVIDIVQGVAPAGVGARTLQESLLLQVRYLTELGQSAPTGIGEILGSHLESLAHGRVAEIARALGMDATDVMAARDFIRDRLTPNPWQGDPSGARQAPDAIPPAIPDVIFSLTDDGIRVELARDPRSQVRINALYARLAASADGGPDATHAAEMVGSARAFIERIEMRQATLARVATMVGELQEDYLRSGIRELRPLTRATVAQQLGLHESTVSRATAHKYVMLPNRQVVPFSTFFRPNLGTKDVIRELVLAERARGRQLSDQRISDLLREQGYRVARRTVTKYRMELGLLPSSPRRLRDHGSATRTARGSLAS